MQPDESSFGAMEEMLQHMQAAMQQQQQAHAAAMQRQSELHQQQMQSMLQTMQMQAVSAASLGSKSPTSRQQDDVTAATSLEYKVEVTRLKHGTPQEAENSVFSFNGALAALGMEKIATGEQTEVSEAESAMLARTVRRWVRDDQQVQTSLRNTFGEHGAGGLEMLQHIKQNFIRPRVIDSFDAEKAIDTFDWVTPFEKTSVEMKAALDQFKDLTARLPDSRKGDDQYWITFVSEHTPTDILTEYDRHLRGLPVQTQQSAATSITEFFVQLGKAIDKANKRADMEDRLRKLRDDSKIRTYAHEVDKKQRNPCPTCGLLYCPKGVDNKWWCDVYDEPGENRKRNIVKYDAYRKKVDEYRKKAGKSKLVYPEEPKVNVHSQADIKDFEDVSDGEQNDDLDGVLAAMTHRWHQSDMQLELQVLTRECADCVREVQMANPVSEEAA